MPEEAEQTRAATATSEAHYMRCCINIVRSSVSDVSRDVTDGSVDALTVVLAARYQRPHGTEAVVLVVDVRHGIIGFVVPITLVEVGAGVAAEVFGALQK